MIFAIKYWKEKDLPCASGVWKYHVKLLMFSPGSGLSVTSPGMLNICFRHARSSIVSMWFRHASARDRAWPGENRNSSPIMFSFSIFFYEHLQRFFIFWFLFYCFLYSDKYKNKTKQIEIEKGRQEHWRRIPTFFFPFTFFSMYIYEDSLSFFFYLISFCTGINTKTEGKKTRN